MAIDPDPVPDPSTPPGPLTRVAFVLSLVLLAALLVMAGRSAPAAPEQRTGASMELVELIRAEQARADGLVAQLDELAEARARLRTPTARDQRIEAMRAQVDELLAPAGLTPVRGPGVVVTLDDAEPPRDGTANSNDLIIHEQDLQAVVNALWAGGAEAVSVAGERVLATTAIRCVGNVLLLHNSTYSPPYVVEAIGDEAVLRRTLRQDATVARFAAASREFGLGFEVETQRELDLPASTGSTTLQEANAVNRSGE